MADPVIILTGHTFERLAIQKWLATKDSCPLSQISLNGNHELLPNITLKQCIDDWKEKFSRTNKDIEAVHAKEIKDSNSGFEMPVVAAELLFDSEPLTKKKKLSNIFLSIKLVPKYLLGKPPCLNEVTSEYKSDFKLLANEIKIGRPYRPRYRQRAASLENSPFKASFSKATSEKLIKKACGLTCAQIEALNLRKLQLYLAAFNATAIPHNAKDCRSLLSQKIRGNVEEILKSSDFYFCEE